MASAFFVRLLLMMKIERDEHKKKGAFYIEEEGEWIAEMTYFRSGDGEITIDHTEIDPKLRGEGIGEDLISEAIKFARAEGLKIKATCPYAKKVLDKHPEYDDVLV
jgi:uncharacterized protein